MICKLFYEFKKLTHSIDNRNEEQIYFKLINYFKVYKHNGNNDKRNENFV